MGMQRYQITKETETTSATHGERRMDSLSYDFFGLVPVPISEDEIQRFFVGTEREIHSIVDTIGTDTITLLQDVPPNNQDHGENLHLLSAGSDLTGIEFSISNCNGYESLSGPHLFVTNFLFDHTAQYERSGVPRPIGVEPYDPPELFEELQFPLNADTAYIGGQITERNQQHLPRAQANTPFVVETGGMGQPSSIWYWSESEQNWIRDENVEAAPDLMNHAKTIACTNPDLTDRVVKYVTSNLRAKDETNKKGDEPFFESGRFKSPEEIGRQFVFPENIDDLAELFILFGTPRSGTTAWGFVMAGHPNVSVSAFQPFKGRIRDQVNEELYLGKRDPNNNEVIVMKDNNGPMHNEELYDPVQILLDAAVEQYSNIPQDDVIAAVKEKLNVVVTLREPVRTFRSLNHFLNQDVDFFARMQQHAVEMYDKYVSLLGEEKVTPFVFDLLDGQTHEAMAALVDSTGLNMSGDLSTQFDYDAINDKMAWGEADPVAHRGYYMEICLPTLAPGEYSYVSSTKGPIQIQSEVEQDVYNKCYANYEYMEQKARAKLNL